MTDSSPLDSIRAGSRVGPWIVEGYAGHGTYGVVYRARRAGVPGALPVALKVARLPGDPRFKREADLLSLVPHRSIPQLVDRGEWHAEGSEVLHPYVVMEWIEGQTLYEWAKEHSPSSREVTRVLAQLAGALAALHRAGGLHRDVKGHNVLVEAGGRAVLMDFGSGTWMGAPPLTEQLMAPGTLEYRSPEALRFRWEHGGENEARYQAGAADDLYALGVSTYRLVTGRYPPPETEPGRGDNPYRAPPQPRVAPLEFNSRLEPQLAGLIERMLKKEAAARGFALELAMEAETLAADAGPEADVPLLGAQGPSKVAVPVQAVVRERPLTDGLVGVGIVAAMLALIGVAAGRRPHVRSEEAPRSGSAGPQEGGSAPDGGTRGLGDNTSTTRAEEYGVPDNANSKALTLQMPDEPLDWQMRTPCRSRGAIAINGGCWRKLEEVPPNCGDDGYEWKNGCYHPVREQPGHPRTSKDPQ
jgi:predicted Ser/Thr protein kinase